MCDLFDDLMPSLSHTTPEGGMFLTATLPAGLHAMKVFEEGVRQKVAVLPGMPFFVDGGGTGMIRLNFSNADEEKISEGMHRLARGYKKAFLKGGRAAVPDRFSLLAQSISFRKLFFHRARPGTP